MTSEFFDCGVTTQLAWLEKGFSAFDLPRLDAYYLQSQGQLESFGKTSFRLRLRLRAAARGARSLFAPGHVL